MMKFLLSALILAPLSITEAATNPPLYGVVYSTNGVVTQYVTGKTQYAASSTTAATPVITVDGTTGTYVFLVTKANPGSGLSQLNNTSAQGSVLDLVTTSTRSSEFVFQARSNNGNTTGLAVYANGKILFGSSIGLGPNATAINTNGLLSFANYSSSTTPIRIYESGNNIYGLGVDGNLNAMRFTAGSSGGFQWYSGVDGGLGIATMTHTGDLTLSGRFSATKIAGNRLYPQRPLDINGYGIISDQIDSSIGNFVKNGVLGSTGPVNAVAYTPPVGFCLFPGLTQLSPGVLLLVYHCSVAENPLTAQDGILRYKISTTSGTTWGSEQTLWNPGSLATQGVQDHEVSAVVGSTVIASIYLAYTSTSAVYVATGNVVGNGVNWSNTGIAVSTTFTSVSATSGKALWLPAVNKWMLPIYGANSGEVGGTAAVVFSGNGGLTWGTQTTVANGNGIGGYNEMNCILLPTGRIVCMIRGGYGYSRAYSDDNGTTWQGLTKVLTTTLQGRPSFTLLQSSATLLVTRWDGLGSFEPTVMLTSWDYGLTWSAPKVISENTNDYSSAVELSSTSIGIAYSDEIVNQSSANIVYRTVENPRSHPASTIQGLDNDGVSLKLSGGLTAPGGIFGVTSGSAPPVGTLGEATTAYIQSSTVAASGTFGIVVTATVTAGNYMCHSHVYAGAGSATPTRVQTQLIAGASGTGTIGDNKADGPPPTADYNVSHSISGFPVNVSASTVMYLQAAVSYPSGMPTLAGRISCFRVH